jgi:hypothetical protein
MYFTFQKIFHSIIHCLKYSYNCGTGVNYMSNTMGVLLKAGNAYTSRAPWFTAVFPSFVLIRFLFFCFCFLWGSYCSSFNFSVSYFLFCLSSFCVLCAPMLAVSLNCPFCIASSVFSNVHFLFIYGM